MPPNDYPKKTTDLAIPSDVLTAVRAFKGKRIQALAWNYLHTDFGKLTTDKSFEKVKAGFAALTFILSKACPEMIPGLRLHYDVVRDMHRDARAKERKRPLIERILRLSDPAPEKRHEVRDLLETFLSESR